MQKQLDDAHCHPVESPESLKCIFSTTCINSYTIMTNDQNEYSLLTDFLTTCDKHKNSIKIIPAFGLHPFNSHLYYDDSINIHQIDKNIHFKSILIPSPDENTIDFLPDPKPISLILSQIEFLLSKYDNALIGEIGLDKNFRIKINKNILPFRVHMNHQKMIMEKLLTLALKYSKPISVHSVQCHGTVFELITNLLKKNNNNNNNKKLNICLHSFSASLDTANLWIQYAKKKNSNCNVFFSFSFLINLRVESSIYKLKTILDKIPLNYILIESDYHSAGEKQETYLQKIFNFISIYKEIPQNELCTILHRNWLTWLEIKD